MKIKHLLLFLFFNVSQNIFAQATFVSVFGDIPNDFYIELHDIKQTSDSGYIVTGYNLQNNQSGPGHLLMKLDKNGDTVWTKHSEFSFAFSPGGESVVQTCDGGYADFGNGILRVNNMGDTLWLKSYTGIGHNQGYLTNDCGFMLLADGLMRVIKTDSTGIPQWSKDYGGYSGSLQQTADGGFIIVGWSNSFSPEYRIYVIKTNDIGDTLWTKSYGLPGNDISGYWIQQTFDNGYTILGGNYDHTYLVRTDSAGNVLWSKSYTGVRFGGSVLQAQDSGFVFTCYVDNIFSWQGYDIMLIKTDSSGNIISHNSFYFGDLDNSVTPIYQTKDGGYVLAGFGMIDNGVVDISHAFVKKMNSNAVACGEFFSAVTATDTSIVASSTATVVTSPVVTISSPFPVTITNAVISAYTTCFNVGTEEIQPSSSPVIYPSIISKNGSTDIFIDGDFKNAVVTVCNAMGNAIYTGVVSSNGKTLLFTLNSKLSPGMYFVRIMEGKKVIVKKIIVV